MTSDWRNAFVRAGWAAVPWSLLLLVLATLGGCARPAQLPTYPSMSAESALGLMAARQQTIKTFTARADLVLTRPDDQPGARQSVSLEGVLIARPPEALRLRAWKLGRAVLDLTVDGPSAWIMTAGDDPSGAPEGASAAQVRGALDLLGPAYFRAAREVTGPLPAGLAVAGDAQALWTSGPALGRPDALCEIDRSTLTPRRFVVVDESGTIRAEMLLSTYALVPVGSEPAAAAGPPPRGKTVAVPMRIEVRAGGGGGDGRGGGVIEIELSEVEINGTLEPGAFVPPARARKLDHQ